MKQKLLIATLILAIITMFICYFKIVTWQKDNNLTRKMIIDIQETMDMTITDNLNIQVNYSKAPEINDEIVGWIRVKGTYINYPFVQHDDNSYYLKHSLDKSYNNAGWIFLDYRNDINKVNKNMILYGHGRVDETMFGSLKNVLNTTWLNNKDNHIIYLSTKNDSYLYKVFSIYHIPTSDDYIKTSFKDDEEYLKFLNMLKDRSVYNFLSDISSDNEILTLSTCYGLTEKLVVHAKLIR